MMKTWFIPPTVIPALNCREPARLCCGSSVQLNSIGASSEARSTLDADGRAEELLARDMIEVHGAEAPTVARQNARTAALAAQTSAAKSWIRVLGIIQRLRRQGDCSLVV